MAPRPGDAHVAFDEFVLARSSGLLRTAYLLTHDHALAEDLLQTALAKAWFAWERIDQHEVWHRRGMADSDLLAGQGRPRRVHAFDGPKAALDLGDASGTVKRRNDELAFVQGGLGRSVVDQGLGRHQSISAIKCRCWRSRVTVTRSCQRPAGRTRSLT